MNRRVVIAVPVKPFAAAKLRLSEAIAPEKRKRLGIGLARHAVHTVDSTGASALVLSADDEVTAWAEEIGVDVLLDPGSSLDRAAEGAVAWATARDMAWGVLHADLPLLERADLVPVVDALAGGRAVLAPSTDAGTSLVGAQLSAFDFSYGPGSFHRHLARLADFDPLIVSRPGLAFDLDRPADLTVAARHPLGRWVADIIGPSDPTSEQGAMR